MVQYKLVMLYQISPLINVYFYFFLVFFLKKIIMKKEQITFSRHSVARRACLRKPCNARCIFVVVDRL